MSNKRRHTELVGVDEILRVSAQSGTIRDRWGNALTLTAMDTFKYGNIRAMEFDGSTSKVDCGVPDTLVGDKTFVAWIYPKSYGESSSGRIFDNAKFRINLSGIAGLNRIICLSDGSTTADTTDDIMNGKFNQWHLLIVTRTSGGVATFYLDDVDVTSASDSGTPVAGTTNLIIGNNDGSAATFDGLIDGIRVYDGLLSAPEISQLFSAERIKYQV